MFQVSSYYIGDLSAAGSSHLYRLGRLDTAKKWTKQAKASSLSWPHCQTDHYSEIKQSNRPVFDVSQVSMSSELTSSFRTAWRAHLTKSLYPRLTRLCNTVPRLLHCFRYARIFLGLQFFIVCLNSCSVGLYFILDFSRSNIFSTESVAAMLMLYQ